MLLDFYLIKDSSFRSALFGMISLTVISIGVNIYLGQLNNSKDHSIQRQQTEIDSLRLYTFTDGYCDQFGGPKGKKFKYKPFRELLISFQDKSMPEQKQILNKTINQWKGELEQIDDICVFGVRV